MTLVEVLMGLKNKRIKVTHLYTGDSCLIKGVLQDVGDDFISIQTTGGIRYLRTSTIVEFEQIGD